MIIGRRIGLMRGGAKKDSPVAEHPLTSQTGGRTDRANLTPARPLQQHKVKEICSRSLHMYMAESDRVLHNFFLGALRSRVGAIKCGT
jgi:hypothetical protein